MDESMELLEYVYQDANMAVTTLTDLLKELNGKDNKIKKDVENILKGYERYLGDTKKMLKKNDVKPKVLGLFTKMGAGMGIKKEVKKDNSDASMADMLIKGITMGTIDIEKQIKNFEEEADQKDVIFAQKFLKFQQDNITALKQHL